MRNEAPAGTVALRPAEPADEPFLRELNGAVVAEQLGQGGLDPDALTALAEIQFKARRRDRATRFPRANEELILLDGRPVGAVLIDCSAERILIIDLAVIPTARRRGIGTTVLAGLVEKASSQGLPLRATTQSTNPHARQLYAQAGFQELDDDGLNLSLERPPRHDS